MQPPAPAEVKKEVAPEVKSPEPPKEKEPEAPKQDSPKATPEKLEGRGAYLAALLAILLGTGITINYLRDINLEKTIERVKRGDPKVPGAGPELANTPVEPPSTGEAQ